METALRTRKINVRNSRDFFELMPIVEIRMILHRLVILIGIDAIPWRERTSLLSFSRPPGSDHLSGDVFTITRACAFIAEKRPRGF
jgi:hypothetical protein